MHARLKECSVVFMGGGFNLEQKSKSNVIVWQVFGYVVKALAALS